MPDAFLIRALLAGVGVAFLAGPFGCFILWRRMAYFGDTLAHSALLGAALALALQIDLTLGVFLNGALIALALVILQRSDRLSSDSALGILSHSALALGLVLLGMMTWVRIDVMSFLFGDILSVRWSDIGVVWIGGLVLLCCLWLIRIPLLAGSVDPDTAKAEGLQPERASLIFTILTAGVIAVAMKIVGALLITALLIIPAAAARPWCRAPEPMVFTAALFGGLSVFLGLAGSLWLNSPTGPTIVTAAAGIFIVSFSLHRLTVSARASR